MTDILVERHWDQALSVRTYLSADRRRMVSLYQAPDAESVRLALQAASVPVERVWAFRPFLA